MVTLIRKYLPIFYLNPWPADRLVVVVVVILILRNKLEQGTNITSLHQE